MNKTLFYLLLLSILYWSAYTPVSDKVLEIKGKVISTEENENFRNGKLILYIIEDDNEIIAFCRNDRPHFIRKVS